MKNHEHPTNYSSSKLLTIDRSGSVLSLLAKPFSYSCYGYLPADHGLSVLLAFNALPLELSTDCYLLGNGRRAYSPVLMRFQSPDALSPFEAGGVNAYGYCGGDPINWQDKSGGVRTIIKNSSGTDGSKPVQPPQPKTIEQSIANSTSSSEKPVKHVKFSDTVSTKRYDLVDEPQVEKSYQNAIDAQNSLNQARLKYLNQQTIKNKIALGKAVEKQNTALNQFISSRKITPPSYRNPIIEQTQIRSQ